MCIRDSVCGGGDRQTECVVCMYFPLTCYIFTHYFCKNYQNIYHASHAVTTYGIKKNLSCYSLKKHTFNINYDYTIHFVFKTVEIYVKNYILNNKFKTITHIPYSEQTTKKILKHTPS